MEAERIQRKPSKIHALWIASRPRTLSIPSIQVIAGLVLAYVTLGQINWFLALSSWLVALFMTIAVNLLNDLIDFQKGGDPLGRSGFLKVLRMGYLSQNEMAIAGFTSLAFTFLFGIPLIIEGGIPLLLAIAVSAIMAYCYTGGPFPISYLGLSEVFVFLFFGMVCIGSVFFVQTHMITLPLLLLITQMGLLAIVPNALNNFRDMDDDALCSKRTLAVQLGASFCRKEIAFLTLIPFLIGFGWIFCGFFNAAFLPLCAFPLAFLMIFYICKTDPGQVFNRYFRLSAIVHLLFGVLLSIGLIL